MTQKLYTTLSILLALSMLTGCGDEEDSPTQDGEVRATVYGEEFIEEGIPAEEMADGWSVTFDRFVVTVENVQIAGTTLPNASPVDIAPSTQGSGHELASATVSAGEHKNSTYTITRAEVSGSATKDNVTKTFAWTFDHTTVYSNCETTTKVSPDAPATFQITVHADHLFYDSLVSEDPSVVFQAIADADADGNGEVTPEELSATGIGSYDPGSAGDVDNLWDWLVAQYHTLGHVDGEGHCDAEIPPQ